MEGFEGGRLGGGGLAWLWRPPPQSGTTMNALSASRLSTRSVSPTPCPQMPSPFIILTTGCYRGAAYHCVT
jgi:hypothetical protein